MSHLIAKNQTEQKLAGLLAPLIDGNGFDLISLRIKAGKKTTLQIMIERADEATITVQDCALLSREVSALLDIEDPIKGDYTLEVSSAGIDRPLTRLQDFERWNGFEAKLETAENVKDFENQRRFRGTLAGVKKDKILLNLIVKEDEPEISVALDFNALLNAKLMLTDELIEQSLKATRGMPAPNTTTPQVANESHTNP